MFRKKRLEDRTGLTNALLGIGCTVSQQRVIETHFIFLVEEKIRDFNLIYGTSISSKKTSQCGHYCKFSSTAHKNWSTAALAVTSADWVGRGIHSTHLVNWSTIIKTGSFPLGVLGRGSRKSIMYLQFWCLNHQNQRRYKGLLHIIFSLLF